jgi:hypothetical protein
LVKAESRSPGKCPQVFISSCFQMSDRVPLSAERAPTGLRVFVNDIGSRAIQIKVKTMMTVTMAVPAIVRQLHWASVRPAAWHAQNVQSSNGKVMRKQSVSRAFSGRQREPVQVEKMRMDKKLEFPLQ